MIVNSFVNFFDGMFCCENAGYFAIPFFASSILVAMCTGYAIYKNYVQNATMYNNILNMYICYLVASTLLLYI